MKGSSVPRHLSEIVRNDTERIDLPVGQELYENAQENPELEECNARLQIEEVRGLILGMNGELALTPQIVEQLQERAIQGIYTCAGRY